MIACDLYLSAYVEANIFAFQITTVKKKINLSFRSIDEIRLRVMVYDVQDLRIMIETGCR